MKLKNKVAIVTGGGKGIGEEISLGLAKEGAKVVVADLDKENSSNVVAEIIKNSGDAIYVETDVSNEESVKNLISETINRFDQIDILINNAGIRHVKKLENMVSPDKSKIALNSAQNMEHVGNIAKLLYLDVFI